MDKRYAEMLTALEEVERSTNIKTEKHRMVWQAARFERSPGESMDKAVYESSKVERDAVRLVYLILSLQSVRDNPEVQALLTQVMEVHR